MPREGGYARPTLAAMSMALPAPFRREGTGGIASVF